MKSSKRTRVLLSVVAVALAVIIVAIVGTVSYLKDQSDTKVNTFDPSKVEVDLDETTDGYKIIPGTTQEKDPTATIDNDIDAYLFVMVEDYTPGLVDYEFAEGWHTLEGGAIELDDGSVMEYTVIYREVGADDDVKTFPVLKDNQVSYPSSLVYEQIKDGAELDFTAYAIQKDPFTSPSQAYAVASMQTAEVSNEDELRAALAAGKAVSLTQDIETDKQINIQKDTVIYGNGKTITSTADYAIVVWEPVGNVVIADLNLEGVTDVAMKGRGVTVMDGANVEIVNSKINARYAIDTGADADSANITVKDSTVSGWHIFYGRADNIEFTAENSTFNSVNKYDNPGSNTYSAFLFGDQSSRAEDGVITLKNCTVNTVEEGNAQQHVFYTRGLNETFTAVNTKFTHNGTEITADNFSMLDETHLSYWWSGSDGTVYSDKANVNINGGYIYNGPLPQNNAEWSSGDFAQYETRN